MESRELAIRLARALDAKKAFNIHILEVEDLTTVTEYFVIATGNSTTHVGALADEAEFQLATTASAGCCWITAASSFTSLPRKPMTTTTWSTCGPMPSPCPPASGCRKEPRPRPNNLTEKPI